LSAFTNAAATPGTTVTNDAKANAAVTPGTALQSDNTTAGGVAIDQNTLLVAAGAASGTSNDLATAITNNSTIEVNGKTITFDNTAASGITAGAGGNLTIGIAAGSTSTIGDVLSAIDQLSGNTGTGTTASSVSGTGQIQLETGTASDLTITGTTGNALAALGLTAAVATPTARASAAADITASTSLVGTASATSNDLGATIANNSTITVNGKSITFDNTAAAGITAGTGGNLTIGLVAGSTIQDVLTAIDQLSGNTGTGATHSTVNNSGQLQLQTGTASDLTIGGTTGTLAALGLTALAAAAPTARTGGATTTPPITGATLLTGPAVAGGASALSTAITNGDTITVNGKTITFDNTTTTASATDATTGNITIGTKAGGTASVQTVLDAIDSITGGTSSIDTTGKISLSTNKTTAITLGGNTGSTALSALGLTGVTTIAVPPAASALSVTTALSGASTASSHALASGFADGDTLTVNGKTITFSSANPTSTSATGGTISTTGTVQDVLDAIDKITGSTGANAASITNGQITLHTGTGSNLSITSSNAGALASLGFGTGVSQADSALTNKTLSIAATGNGVATNITFGTAAGQVSTLNDLNAALAANNLQATIDSTGAITITTTNNAASSTVGNGSAITGTAFTGLAAASAPVLDPNAQATRAGLITQYNNTLKQIDTTAQDSSFNGVNLLQGDTLNLTFDETGKSTLAIQGVTFNTAGLGLQPLISGADFLDSNSANKVLASLTNVSTTLRSEASSLGSNLSIVQIRQDFSKNLINVLQTGASNLTLADTNEEAANSQALSTRQSIAVSALALANQSQQSVLQLLR
jgi:hypothetical protein